MAQIFPPLQLVEVVRVLLVIATAGFLPGFFLYARHLGKNGWREAFEEDFFEAVGVSVIVSFVVLALAAALLTFTVGFSLPAIVVLETIIIVGAFSLWKK